MLCKTYWMYDLFSFTTHTHYTYNNVHLHICIYVQIEFISSIVDVLISYIGRYVCMHTTMYVCALSQGVQKKRPRREPAPGFAIEHVAFLTVNMTINRETRN